MYRREFLSALLDENDLRDVNDDIEKTTFYYIMWSPAVISITLLCFGLLKASFGCCFNKLDKWYFDNVQTFRTYEDAGRLWRFSINVIFFFLLPFAKCCGPRVIFDNPKLRTNFRKCNFYDDDSDERENSRLLNETAPYFSAPSSIERCNFSSETIFDKTSLRNPFEKEEEDEELVKEYTDYVVKAMNESIASLKKFESKDSTVTSIDDSKEEAKKFVEELLTSRIVYRTFKNPLGEVRIKHEGHPFSIRGYFIPSRDKGYQFVTYNPLKQIYDISNDCVLVPIAPQIFLDSKAFRKYYKTKNDVYDAGDLSVQPAVTSPCINVGIQDRSMYTK